MYALTPVDSASISAMPIMPIEPAKEVIIVLPFLVRRLLKLKASEVRKLILALPRLPCFSACTSFAVNGSVSSIILPSLSLIILVAYSSASSGLCVTITTSLSFATCFKSSITCIDVCESSAPVGSSASSISGSLTSARAIATRCICPPES